jgi:hypothetical protein
MTCNDYQQIIDSYLDEALPVSDRVAFELHLRDCSSCTAEVERARLLLHTLHEMPKQACPEYVVSRILTDAFGARPRPEKASLVDHLIPGFFRRLPAQSPALGWALMLLLLIGFHFLSKLPDRIERTNYTAAELRETKTQIDQAFGIFFHTVRKSEKIAREEVLLSKVVRPIKAGLRQVYEPPSRRGAL